MSIYNSASSSRSAGATRAPSLLARPALFAGWLPEGLRGVTVREGLAVRERKGNCIGYLFSHLVRNVFADHQLKQNASLQLFDGIHDFVTGAGVGFPLGVDPARRRDLDLQVRVSEPAFPCDGSCRQTLLLGRSSGLMR